MAVLKADRETCQGYANCVAAAPDTFDLGDDGVVVVRKAEIADSDRAMIEDAVYSCPMAALSIDE